MTVADHTVKKKLFFCESSTGTCGAAKISGGGMLVNSASGPGSVHCSEGDG